MTKVPGPFQYQILRHLKFDPTYGSAIAAALTNAHLGAIYTTLERMQANGLVQSQWTEPLPIRGGRSRRIYSITDSGLEAINLFQEKYGIIESVEAPHR